MVILEFTFRFLPVSEPPNRVLPTRDDPIVRYYPNDEWLYSVAWNFVIVNQTRTNNKGWVSDIDYVKDAETPLLAFVGDSFVQAGQLPWRDSCHGRLSTKLDGQIRVYSFGHNAAPLSQYLGYAQYIRDTYSPVGLVIPIIENDFDQSFRHAIKQTRHHMFFAFEEAPNGELVLVPPAVKAYKEPTSWFVALNRWVSQHSSLVRYRTNHVRDRFFPVWDDGTQESQFSPTASATAHPDTVQWARRATDAFLRMLPEKSGLDPARIVFVVDGLRPLHYTEGWEDQLDGSFHGVLRRYFKDQARADGYEVIDMHPVFVDHYRSHKEPFNWTRDKHWNALGHGLCAEQVAQSHVMKQVVTAASPMMGGAR